jgi:hypothetical protein
VAFRRRPVVSHREDACVDRQHERANAPRQAIKNYQGDDRGQTMFRPAGPV